MRKVEKDCSPAGIPVSLRHPDHGDFWDGYELRRARTTHERRKEVIAAGKYFDEDKYNERYKQDDIKVALRELYKGKCAYCEMRVIGIHVEHYRPKSVYYWLAYSWDNLLRCCSTCNAAKGTHFRVQGVAASPHNPLILDAALHQSRTLLDALEQPDLVNPEVDDLSEELIYQKDGSVRSDHPRLDYTIGVCHLDEKPLRDERARIWQGFIDHLEGEELRMASHAAERITILKTILGILKREAADPEEGFTTFRRYMLQHWVKGELQKLVH